jgi:hypothetical protein
VKPSVLFRKESAIKDMVQDLYKYLTYAKSQERLTLSKTDTTSGLILIISILAIQLHKHGCTMSCPCVISMSFGELIVTITLKLSVGLSSVCVIFGNMIQSFCTIVMKLLLASHQWLRMSILY